MCLRMRPSIFQDIFLFWMEFIHILLYRLAVLIPLNNKIWIFGSWFGETYNDNSRYIFEYVNKNLPDITAVWLSRKKELVGDLRKKGYRAYHFYSVPGVWFAMRAGVGIFCVGYTVDLPGFCITNSKKLVQLWHGIGVKKVGVLNTKPLNTGHRIFPSIQNKYIIKLILSLFKALFFRKVDNIDHIYYKMELFSLYTYITALSPVIKKMTVECFDIPKDQKERVLITGSPRNDVLFAGKKPQGRAFEIIKNIHKKGGSAGFYMPTHRREGSDGMLNNIIDSLKPYQKILEEKKIYLLVKLHQFHQYESQTDELKNVIFIRNEDLDGDVYPLLPATDFLVTDYSTIYIDYLLVDKPIIFLNYDLEQYTNIDRELYFPYERVTPGPKVSSWEKLIPAVSRELKKDSYIKFRQRIRKLFHTYSDDNSSKRIAEKVYDAFVAEK